MNEVFHDNNQQNKILRRKFIATLGKAAGSAAVLSLPVMSKANVFFDGKRAQITVGGIMDLFIKQVPGAPFEKTVDTLKAGNRDIVVSGVITTMFATVEVIKKAIDTGANFIIAHEPTFYNHEDDVSWLQDNSVYRYKKDLLENHNIAVWRNHDYIHSLQPDGVGEGVLNQLEWKPYYDGNKDAIVNVPAMSLAALIKHAKDKLNIKEVRYIGDLSQSCKKVLLLPGAAGGKTQIEMMNLTKPDVLVCGEIQEWETAEYVRDARSEGNKISLVVLGHIASEEPGSEWMMNWLKKNVPGVPVTHIPAGNSLSFA